MEPNADSITASTETSGVDYGRYTTYQTLKDLSDLNPDLWMNLVDLAWDDLHGNYEFSGEEYPLGPKFETMRQRKGREDIITEWRVVLNDWTGTAKQQTQYSYDVVLCYLGSGHINQQKKVHSKPPHVFRSYVCNPQLPKHRRQSGRPLA